MLTTSTRVFQMPNIIPEIIATRMRMNASDLSLICTANMHLISDYLKLCLLDEEDYGQRSKEKDKNRDCNLSCLLCRGFIYYSVSCSNPLNGLLLSGYFRIRLA